MTRQPKLFRTAIVDPPWAINQGGRYGAERHYDLLTIEQLKALPISELMEEAAGATRPLARSPRK